MVGREGEREGGRQEIGTDGHFIESDRRERMKRI